MQEKFMSGNPLTDSVTEQFANNREAIAQLANSEETQSLMDLLRQSGNVEQAAQDAASGKPDALMAMVEQLVSTKQGAALIQQIEVQAKRVGLDTTSSQ